LEEFLPPKARGDIFGLYEFWLFHNETEFRERGAENKKNES